MIFFDFDGVIVESVNIKTEAFAILFEREGSDIVKMVLQYHLNNTGVSRYEKIRYIYDKFLKRPIGDTEFHSLCDRFSSLVTENVINASYVRGAKEFLEAYGATYDCYVVSATPHDELRLIMERKKLTGYFKGIYGAPAKKTDAIKTVLANKGLTPINAVYVGDAMSDLESAKANGVLFIARINGNKAIFDNVNCIKIDDLTQFKRIIDNIEKDTWQARIS
ncbi:hydrolase, haloacid dehalogenase [Candidatus Magnetobacterium bavaricum]|uniref:phosphoglycolate phosphatase n=1 Tax=Candidatus Magnetobacterium bavaricum TaxID=29290 RepID=A0A0F3GN24_9BACT|nr:hydrolase, haloacid dehalogenase [Candidatus Magnetobacterium bavaricum]